MPEKIYWVTSNPAPLVGAPQGIAFDGTYYYYITTTALYKLDVNLNIVASNLTAAADCGGNHMGDGAVYNGKLYAACVNAQSMDSWVGIWNTSDLSQFDSFSGYRECAITVNTDANLIVNIELAQANSIGPSLYHTFDFNTHAPIATITPSSPLWYTEGMDFYGGHYYTATAATYDCGWGNMDPTGGIFKMNTDGTGITRIIPYSALIYGGEMEGVDVKSDYIRVQCGAYIYKFNTASPYALVATYPVGALGGAVDLTDGTVYDVRQGINGRHMPTYTFTSQKMFTYPGEVLRNVSVNKREITLPITVYGTSAENLRANLRALQGYFDPMQGQGTLKWVSDDVSPITRQLDCRYESGMEFLESPDTGNYKTRIFTPVFIAHSPYWYDPTQVQTRLIGGSNTVTNSGDVDTWPLIICTGPVNDLVLMNNTTGKTIEWDPPNGAFLLGDALYINCVPGSRSCCVNGTTCVSTLPWPSVYTGRAGYLLTPTSTLNFNLVPGDNSITVTAGGSSGQTMLYFRHYNQYNGI
jgi:hypothetical protein